ncbi:hypothetical protein [Streptomyces sp. 135]|uniref:hypothetical protein n=1 Tax=Streptomyces sp. 135 TaxID=2838850 RepID=UPI001CC003C6|nr:hypothetical protein [Streptomyces sp. 135]
MGSEGLRPGPGPQDEPVCEACGQPVGTVIRRRKVLGVFVPVWGPGPCRNGQCEARVDAADAARSSAERAVGRRLRSRRDRRATALSDSGERDASEEREDPAAPPSAADDDIK